MVVFALRHAERRPDPIDGLSPAGRARAWRLGHMLAESGVRVAYCSDAVRTQETLAPLESLVGEVLKVHRVSAAAPGGPESHIEAVVAAVQALPEDTAAVIVSHSNTVGPIVERLGGGTIPPFEEPEFDRILILFGSRTGPKKLLQLRY
jgi:phosphohistidine phosphatase SixA